MNSYTLRIENAVLQSEHYSVVTRMEDSQSVALDVINELSRFLIENFDQKINPEQVAKAQKMNTPPIDSQACHQAINFIMQFSNKEIMVVENKENYHSASGLYLNCWRREILTNDFNAIPWLDKAKHSYLKPNTPTVTKILTISLKAFQHLLKHVEALKIDEAKRAAQKKADENQYLIYGTDLEYCKRIHSQRMAEFFTHVKRHAPIAEIPDNAATKAIIRQKRLEAKEQRATKRDARKNRRIYGNVEAGEITLEQLKNIQMDLLDKFYGGNLKQEDETAYVNWFRSRERYQSFTMHKKEAGSILCFFICIDINHMSELEYRFIWSNRYKHLDKMEEGSYKRRVEFRLKEMEKADHRKGFFDECAVQ